MMIKKHISNFLVAQAKKASRQGLDDFLQRETHRAGLSQGSQILSIGAGGEVNHTLRSLGLRPIEVDIDATRNPDLVQDLANLNQINDNQFDAVYCAEVLEHVRDVHKGIAEIYRVLRPGGRLIGSTPFLMPIHEAPVDFWRFTRYGLQELFCNFNLMFLDEKDGYFENQKVILLRSLFYQPTEIRRKILAIYPALALTAYGLATVFSFTGAKNATTGYFFVCEKPASRFS